MKKFIDLTKWFYKTSISYMEGYSKWYIYTRMPRAFIRFMYFTYCKDGMDLKKYLSKTFNTKDNG